VAANWSGSSVPDSGTAEADFGATTNTTPALSASISVGKIVFLLGAPAYTVTVSPGTTLTVSGAGLANTSGLTQNFVVSANAAGAVGNIQFTNTATIGAAIVIANDSNQLSGSGSFTLFDNSSSAGQATFNDYGSAVSGASGGYTYFANSSTADSSIINNEASTVSSPGGNSGGYTNFVDTSTAGTATITNFAATLSGAGDGFTVFFNSATAGNATFINNGSTVTGQNGGVTQFFNTSDAGHGTFTNGGATASGAQGGITQFNDTSTAANGAITNNAASVSGASGGTTVFLNNSTAGSAAITNNGATVAGAGGGNTSFENSSTAGNATLLNHGGAASGGSQGFTNFFNSSTAGNGVFTNDAGTVNGAAGGDTTFLNSANAASGVFTNVGVSVSGADAGSTVFLNSANGGNASITDTASTVSGGSSGNASFLNNSTAGNAVIMNNGATVNGAEGGLTLLFNTATAGNASLTNSGALGAGAQGGLTIFLNSATAGNASFTSNGTLAAGGTGGITEFLNTSTAGRGIFVNNGSIFAENPTGGSGGATYFYNSATAGNGLFTDNASSGLGDSEGTTGFFNTSTAGNGIFTNNGSAVVGAHGGQTEIGDSATAGAGHFTDHAGTLTGATGGFVSFSGAATGGNGVFANDGATIAGASGGFILFRNNATAGNGVFTNNGSLVNSAATAVSFKLFVIGAQTDPFYLVHGDTTTLQAGASTQFFDSATAGNATFINTAGTVSGATGGYNQFYDTSTAGGATITNNGATVSGARGGFTQFLDNSTGGNATLIANGGANGGSGGMIFFSGTSTVGSARVEVFGNGGLDISGLTSLSATIGSIEGNGNVFLGAKNVAIGGNNLSTIFSGVIQDGGQSGGSGGSLTKTGAGSLDLTGVNTYTGNTTVSQGALYVDGSIASANTYVSTRALLGGRGSIAGNLFNSGVVNPGYTAQTLTVNGNYTQAPSGTLTIYIGGLTPSQHDVLSVGGVANLAGTLQIVSLNNFRFTSLGQSITFLNANGGIHGTFTNVIDTLTAGSLFTTRIVDPPGSLTVEPYQAPIAPFVELSHGTPNELSVARALDASATDPRNFKLLSYLDTQSPANLLRDLDRLGPAELTSTFQIAFTEAEVEAANLERQMEDIRAGSNGFNALRFSWTPPASTWAGSTGPTGNPGPLLGPDGKGAEPGNVMAPSPNNRWGVFITGDGESANLGDTFNSRGYDLTDADITVGVDFKATDHFALGAGLSYDQTTADLTSQGRITVNGAKLALYGTFFTEGGFYSDFIVQGGYNTYDSHRAALEGDARSSTSGGQLISVFGTGWDFKAGGITFGPVATFKYILVGFDRFTEQGSLAPLTVPSQHQESITTALGAKATCDWQLGRTRLRPELRLRWKHEYSDNTLTMDSGFANGAGPDFAVRGPAIGRDSMLIGAGFTIQWSDRFSTNLFYDGELLRANYLSNNITGGFRLDF
jgi:uncharacterized protein with beta-barrel porin domain